jgi:hypothetical protein
LTNATGKTQAQSSLFAVRWKLIPEARSAWDDSNYVRKRKSPQDARDSTDENAKQIFTEDAKKCGGKLSGDEALREWAMRTVEIKEH